MPAVPGREGGLDPHGPPWLTEPHNLCAFGSPLATPAGGGRRRGSRSSSESRNRGRSRRASFRALFSAQVVLRGASASWGCLFRRACWFLFLLVFSFVVCGEICGQVPVRQLSEHFLFTGYDPRTGGGNTEREGGVRAAVTRGAWKEDDGGLGQGGGGQGGKPPRADWQPLRETQRNCGGEAGAAG